MLPPSSKVIMRKLTVVATIALATVAFDARAQAAQTWSILGSPFFTAQKFTTSTVAGAGAELQLRYSLPGVSIGLGGQYSSHSSGNESMKISGLFLEPRYAPDIGSEQIVPYVAARLAFLHQTGNFASASNGYAAGAGGGVMIKINRRVNLDLGGAIVQQSFGDVTLNRGGSARFEAFTGYVAKAGLSVGFGK